MLASKLIDKLQELIQEHGDLEVTDYCDDSTIADVEYLNEDETESGYPQFQTISNMALST